MSTQNTDTCRNINEEGIPDYIYKACEECTEKVLAHQSKHSFNIAMFSDLHYPLNEETKSSAVHAAAALKIISRKTRLDLAAFLGDYVVGGPVSKKNASLTEAYEVTEMFQSAAHGIPQLWLNGNHDILPYNDDSLSLGERFSFIGSRNFGVITDKENLHANYGYRDFDEAQLRVIYLNTSDIGYKCQNAGQKMKYYMSRRQFEFTVKALDLSCKAHAEKWKIIFLSHFPIDWPVMRRRNEQGILMPDEEPPQLPIIIEDYTFGRKGSIYTKDGDVEYDFTGKNSAPIAAAFNGHTHCLNTGVIGKSGVPRITVPNLCCGRENEYGQSGNYLHGEKNTYRKFAGSASDTAFNIITLDMENGEIFCTCCGAGYDRCLKMNGR